MWDVRTLAMLQIMRPVQERGAFIQVFAFIGKFRKCKFNADKIRIDV